MRKARTSESMAASASPLPGEYKPQSADYEQDDDGFSESDGALIPGAGLRTTFKPAVEWLQQNCPRRHARRRQSRVCSLCLVEIPAKDG